MTAGTVTVQHLKLMYLVRGNALLEAEKEMRRPSTEYFYVFCYGDHNLAQTEDVNLRTDSKTRLQLHLNVNFLDLRHLYNYCIPYQN